MESNEILPDDPRLTAYALGEMTPEERAQFEPHLRQDAAALAAVAEIQAAAASLTAALAHEAAEPVHAVGLRPRPAARLLRFPQLYFVVSGLAAACFAVFFAIWQREHDGKEIKHYLEVPLTSVSDDKKELAPAAVDGESPVVALTRETVSQNKTSRPPAVAADADTASYANVRRLLLRGLLPSADTVRVDEMVNYFPYDYPGAEEDAGAIHVPPFAAHLEVAGAPWAPAHRLVRFGLKGRGEIGASLPAANSGRTRPVAKDVTIEVEFNSALVQAYRLIGYESRPTARKEVNQSQVETGELGAGRTVTALYEVVPAGVAMVEPGPEGGLKFQWIERPNANDQTPTIRRL